MSDIIKVTYDLYSSSFSAYLMVEELSKQPVVAFDIETRGVYSPEERKKAAKLLAQEGDTMSLQEKRLVSIVANNTGLSFPSLTKTTHFIFSHSKDHSKIVVCDSFELEMKMWRWIAIRVASLSFTIRCSI